MNKITFIRLIIRAKRNPLLRLILIPVLVLLLMYNIFMAVATLTYLIVFGKRTY
jgi:hypothetical protein